MNYVRVLCALLSVLLLPSVSANVRGWRLETQEAAGLINQKKSSAGWQQPVDRKSPGSLQQNQGDAGAWQTPADELGPDPRQQYQGNAGVLVGGSALGTQQQTCPSPAPSTGPSTSISFFSHALAMLLGYLVGKAFSKEGSHKSEATVKARGLGESVPHASIAACPKSSTQAAPAPQASPAPPVSSSCKPSGKPQPALQTLSPLHSACEQRSSSSATPEHRASAMGEQAAGPAQQDQPRTYDASAAIVANGSTGDENVCAHEEGASEEHKNSAPVLGREQERGPTRCVPQDQQHAEQQQRQQQHEEVASAEHEDSAPELERGQEQELPQDQHHAEQQQQQQQQLQQQRRFLGAVDPAATQQQGGGFLAQVTHEHIGPAPAHQTALHASMLPHTVYPQDLILKDAREGRILARPCDGSPPVPYVKVDVSHRLDRESIRLLGHMLSDSLGSSLRSILADIGQEMWKSAEPVVKSIHGLAAAASGIATQLAELAAQGRLSRQQALCTRSFQCGLLVMLARLVLAALVDGCVARLASLTSSCEARVFSSAWYSPARWTARLLLSDTLGLWHLGSVVCFLQHLGTHALGVLGLGGVIWYVLPRLFGDLHQAWPITVLLGMGGAGGYVGMQLVSLLGGVWKTWLLLWEMWIGLACLMYAREIPSAWQRLPLLVLLAIVLPFCAGHLPFNGSVLY